jgi:antitoxin MazE
LEDAVRAKIQRWGNCLGVRIPKPFAEELGLCEEAKVELSLVEGSLVVRPLRGRAYALATLLAGVTDCNGHHEGSDFGPIGREAW